MSFSEVQIGNCRCINADMEDVLPTLDARSVAIVTDPPFGIGMDKKNAHSSIRDNPKWGPSNWDDVRSDRIAFDMMRETASRRRDQYLAISNSLVFVVFAASQAQFRVPCMQYGILHQRLSRSSQWDCISLVSKAVAMVCKSSVVCVTEISGEGVSESEAVMVLLKMSESFAVV